ncbi:oxidoreductase [Hyphomicrobium sp.]|uniref:oxidoreductase n=1 Tax=Hyphomicrobium sp. TaxID=82 RepID=UPI0025BA5B84|nr:oxidoreductase [Hyphomicrobium sp.]MCC7253832.1 oxidoreductase [Hyphomicrobium sp.]
MPPLPQPINHTVEAIYGALARRSRHGDSRGIPVGSIGEECERKLWYALRWAAPAEQITGQKQRLFGTGLREEERLIEDLRAAGVRVEATDPANGQQFRVELADGWLRGKIDGRAEGVPEAPATMHVLECKSHNERSFKELVKHAPPKGEGLRKAKPEHFAQCQTYMLALGLTRGLYLAVNKNTDELYAERLVFDAAFAIALESKATRIARTDRAPARLHDDVKSKAAFACAWCPALGLCHEGQFARVNCRTCLHAQLEAGAEVRCALSGQLRSYNEQQVGCASHLFLPDLVPGIQMDAGETWVEYELRDGTLWRDAEELQPC